MKKLSVFTILLFFLTSAIHVQAGGDFISAQDVAKLIKANQVILVSARSEADYKKAHLKDAVHVDHKDLYKEGEIKGLLKSP